jgi:hypothetical protein
MRNNCLEVSIIYKDRKLLYKIGVFYFIKLDHIRVTNFFKDVYFTSDTLNVCLVLYFVLFEYLYRDLLVGDGVSSDSHLAESSLSQ